MASAFAFMLPALYAKLALPATHTRATHTGPVVTPVRVLFDQQGGGGGVVDVTMGDSPQLRVRKAALPAGIERGDIFVVEHDGGNVAWVAAEDGTAILDGEELSAPVRQCAC